MTSMEAAPETMPTAQVTTALPVDLLAGTMKDYLEIIKCFLADVVRRSKRSDRTIYRKGKFKIELGF